jgi:hypothetical protein
LLLYVFATQSNNCTSTSSIDFYIRNQQDPQILNAFIDCMKKITGDKGILIVGHTNILSAIIFGLCGQNITPIAENDYDNIYIITINNGNKTLQQLTYGKPSP